MVLSLFLLLLTSPPREHSVCLHQILKPSHASGKSLRTTLYIKHRDISVVTVRACFNVEFISWPLEREQFSTCVEKKPFTQNLLELSPATAESGFSAFGSLHPLHIWLTCFHPGHWTAESSEREASFCSISNVFSCLCY